jgi:hypothetical protein
MEKVAVSGAAEGKFTAAGSPGKARSYLIRHEWNASARAVNRLFAEFKPGQEEMEVFWAEEELKHGGATYAPGTILIRPARGKDIRARIEKLAAEAQVEITELDSVPAVPAWKLRPPRIGLYQPWTASMDEGWTRWLLEQYEFPYATLHNADVRGGKLGEKYDVIVFASQSKNSILNGNRGEWVRPEHRGGLGEEGQRAIEEFVRGGGTLVTLDAAADFAIDALGLPVRNVLRGVSAERFYCPGAILQILVDPRHPVAYGMPERTSAYFLNSPAFELTAPFSTSTGRAVVKYPATNPLQSGWIGGPDHLYDKLGVAEISHGKGRVVLLGFRAQFRAQPHATFKLLFNSLHWAAATRTTSR